MQPSRRLTIALLLAVSSVLLFVHLLENSDSWSDLDGAGATRRLHATGQTVLHYRWHRWGPRHVIGLVLSVLVSVTSSIDRECGASLYMVLFAALLEMPFRRAAAMTAFTVALGALGPGILSMSEAQVTERGIRALVDYPGALVLLPAMFWGISFGVIVNLWFPNWLLALLWVTLMLGNNVELGVSFIKYLGVKRESARVVNQLKDLEQHRPGATAGRGADVDASIELSEAAAAAAAGSSNVQQKDQGQQAGQTAQGSLREHYSNLLARAHDLARQAHRIEAAALLYPTFYIPPVKQALKDANIGRAPCNLVASATPSCIGAMDAEKLEVAQQLAHYQTVFGRFTFSWHKWWALNPHFEIGLVLKIVVMHLATEALRHHMSKPCTKRYWVMLFFMSGLVTGFLTFVVTCYSRRRLWRGPHWVDALEQVRQLKKQQQTQQMPSKSVHAPAPATEMVASSATGSSQARLDADSPAAAAVASGQAVAVNLAAVNGSSAAATGELEQPEQQPGCWPRFKKRLPFVWVTAPEAVTNISACNSYNQYKNWKVPLILTCAATTLPIGILGCALGLPGGPIMAYLLLALGLKPRIVAGTSRFLVLCFTFGSFVAHIITGNLEPTLAAAYGLLNLGLAPLGMLIFTKLRPRGAVVIGLSLAMGVTGLIIIIVWQLAPLLGHLANSHVADPKQWPTALMYDRVGAVSASHHENNFDLGRFCNSAH